MSQQLWQIRWNPHERIKLGNWWTFPNKRWLLDVNGSTEKENQSSQRGGIGSKELLPPIGKYTSIQKMLSIRTMYNLAMEQLDVKTTLYVENYVKNALRLFFVQQWTRDGQDRLGFKRVGGGNETHLCSNPKTFCFIT